MRKVSMTAVAALGMIVASSPAQEKRLTHSQLPPAVAAAADREAQGSTIKGYSTEREGGKTVYEVETIVDGRTRDIQIAPDGSIREIEQEVTLESLSASVRGAITQSASGAKIVKIESLTKRGKLVAYEASLLKGNRKSEIQVGPAGERLQHEE